MKDPIMSRLVRVESKLTKLMLYSDVPPLDLTGNVHNVPTSMHDVGRALVRIETKLHALMKANGLDPFGREAQ